MIKRNIKDDFFKAFEKGGAVHQCIEILKKRYDLGYTPPLKRSLGKVQSETIASWNKVALEQIKEAYDEFDYTVIEYTDSSLMNEIATNLSECKTDKEKEKYIFSLLKPFKELSDIYYPKAVINQIENKITDYNEKIKKIQEGCSNKKEDEKHTYGLNRIIDNCRMQIGRIRYINKRFYEILRVSPDEEHRVEWWLINFLEIERLFANRLDALLLEHGIDLMRLQEECGIYLKLHRRVEDVEPYIGSMKLAQKYIDELGTHKENKQIKENSVEAKSPIPLIPLKNDKKNFKDCILYEDKEALIEKLHGMIDGKRGVDIGVIFTAAISASLIRKPTKEEYTSEFTLIGTWEAIRKAINTEDNNIIDKARFVVFFP